jgi:hypothetical protein
LRILPLSLAGDGDAGADEFGVVEAGSSAMSWVRLDDAYPRHPKILKAGAEAFILDVSAICHSNCYGTDGFIADEILHSLSPLVHDPSSTAARLVVYGRWVRDEARGGYLIHDYLEYQPTAEEVAERRERLRTAGQKGAAARWRGKPKPEPMASAMPKRMRSASQSQSESHADRNGTSRPHFETYRAVTATGKPTGPVEIDCENSECSNGWTLDEAGDAVPCQTCRRQA